MNDAAAPDVAITSSPDAPNVILSVQLAGFPPLPNALRRMFWAKRADETRNWRYAAKITALQALRESEHPEDFPLRRAVLRVTVIRPAGHDPDPDNAQAACKPLVDGMVDSGVMVSDRRSCVSFLPVAFEVGETAVRIDVVMGAS